MKYTKETLSAINSRYLGSHWMDKSDVAKANRYVDLIESTRSTTQPKPGDILQYLDEHGGYYPTAHIEKTKLHVGGNICEHASVPFIHTRKNGISCSASGGAWHDVPLEKMIYVGKAKKRFCDWGSCGACANGAIEFEAEVSVWKYEEPNQQTPGYSTKEFDRFYLDDSGEDSRYTKETGYRFRLTSWGVAPRRAFKNREELDAWLTTFKGKVFNRGSKNSAIVWTWKQFTKHVSPMEFDAMAEPEDTFIFNGAVRRCKRIYDERNHTVTTCFVWYWQEDGNFYEVLERQNKIREKRYTLPWNTPEFRLAREGRL